MTVAILLVTGAADGRAQEPQFEYLFFKDPVPLTLDPFQIAVLSPATSPVIQLGLETFPSTPLTAEWSLVDVSGSPSGNDTMSVVALIEELAAEPGNTDFFAPVFTDFELNVSMIAGPTINVGFVAGVTLEEATATVQSVGAGAILNSNWLGLEDVYQVDGNTRSGLTVLERANALALLANVEFASVSWLFTGELVDVDESLPLPALMSPIDGFEASPLPPIGRGTAAAKAVELCTPLAGLVQDQLFHLAWNLEQPGSSIHVNAMAGWALCGGDASVVIAVLDDGVEPFHPDLPRQLPGFDVTDDCPSPPCAGGEPKAPCDRHGTAVAGVAVSAANLVGSRGVAPNVTILPIRIGKYREGDTPATRCRAVASEEALARGVSQAVARGADIINLSWNYGTTILPEAVEAIESAVTQGVVFFNSAGNHGLDFVEAPGMVPKVMSISALNRNGNLANGTENVFNSNHGADVDFTGPGVDIPTTDRTGTEGYDLGAFTVRNGTSYACPHYAGLAAALISCRPDLVQSDIEFILRHTALDLGPAGWDSSFGWGLMDLGTAMHMAQFFIQGSDFEHGDLSEWSTTSSSN